MGPAPPVAFSLARDVCYLMTLADRSYHRPASAPEALRRRRRRGTLGRGVGTHRRPPLRPDAFARGDVRGRHAAAHRLRVAARGTRVQLQPHRLVGALTAYERPARLISTRVRRQRPTTRR